MTVHEIQAKTCLVESKLPGTDYVINPYVGCAMACAYCYASFMGRSVGESRENWGNYIYAKVNIVGLLEKELARRNPEKLKRRILISSVTDAYQGAETKYKLTRGILSVLRQVDYPGNVGILTKSPMVLRDVDQIQGLADAVVGITVTTTDDKISRFLECRAPLASRRIDTLRTLNTLGIRTYAFIGPLLPHFRYQPELLDELFRRLAEAGVRDIFVEHMNLRPLIKQRLVQITGHDAPYEGKNIYGEAAGPEHKRAVEDLVHSLVDKYGFRLMLQKVLDHNG